MKTAKARVTASCPYCGKEAILTEKPIRACIHYRRYRSQLMEVEWDDPGIEVI
ncbi:MAG: hypothetical protein M1162_05260 [Candidatus Thermoplasmatota archaeon]|nr:hypothetical protein [Candidatus Thermoplasmatota archaeon]